MDKFDHVYAAISIWTSEDNKRPTSTMWEYEAVKKAFHKIDEIKIGGIVKDDQGVDYKVTDVSLKILSQPNDNKYGIDFSQTGKSDVNNVVVNITIKKA
jgi:hypothetical protein